MTARAPGTDITAERWAAIEAAYAEASSLSDAQRSAFLAALDRDDPALAAEVRSLLASSDGWWLDDPIVALPTSPNAVPERIGPYQLVRPLGRGGMGEVWLAVRESADFRQHVALKIVRSGLESAELIAGFRAERQILASLNHPNIAHLLDVGETPDGRPFLALEFVEGLPLTEYCEQHRLTIDDRLRLFRQICVAVRFAHQNLVVHQDLKPSNILVTASGVPKLLDFGIAKVLLPGGSAKSGDGGVPLATPEHALTPEYAAPEQIEGGATTTASDVYALGVVLYQLLSGRLPYSRAESREALLQRIRETPPPPSAVADAPRRARLVGDLDAIVLRALGRSVDERYSSVEQLVADLDRSLTWHPVSARPRTASYVAGRFVRRNRAGVAVAVLALVALTGFVGTVMLESAEIRDRSAQVERERQRAVAVSSFLEDLFRGADPTATLGDTISARALLDRGAARVERELASQPATQGDLMMVMSEIYQNLGLYKPAEDLAGKAIVRFRARGGSEDSVLAASYVAHGKALHYLDRTTEAAAAYDTALGVRKRLGDTSSVIVAQTLAYLGSVRQDQRADSTAERLYRTAIALERARGRTATDTTLAFTLNNLGVFLRKQRGDLAGAEAAYREAIAIRRRALGENHPETIRTTNNLAVVVGARGNLAGAESLFTDVLERWRRVLGPDHPTVAFALNNLGGLALRRNDPARAVALHNEALAIRRARLSPTAPEIATSLTNLGIALEASGDRAGAARSFREALAIRLAHAGPNDPSVTDLQKAIDRLTGRAHAPAEPRKEL